MSCSSGLMTRLACCGMLFATAAVAFMKVDSCLPAQPLRARQNAMLTPLNSMCARKNMQADLYLLVQRGHYPRSLPWGSYIRKRALQKPL